MRSLRRAARLLVACMVLAPAGAQAQSRGVYPLGMTAVGSGVTPDPGVTYANQLLFYSRAEVFLLLTIRRSTYWYAGRKAEIGGVTGIRTDWRRVVASNTGNLP